MKYTPTNRLASQRGEVLIEFLSALLILSISSMAVAYNTAQGLKQSKANYRDSVAAQLAGQRMEEFAATNPAGLTAANNSTETGILVNNVEYTRSSTITVNADGSRTITVSVQGTGVILPGSASLTTKFAAWGNT